VAIGARVALERAQVRVAAGKDSALVRGQGGGLSRRGERKA
jgi:hypothetical protein